MMLKTISRTMVIISTGVSHLEKSCPTLAVEVADQADPTISNNFQDALSSLFSAVKDTIIFHGLEADRTISILRKTSNYISNQCKQLKSSFTQTNKMLEKNIVT